MKDQDSKAASVRQSDGVDESHGSGQAISSDLVDIEIIEKHGHSVLVQFDRDGLCYRSYVDKADLVGEQCPRERLADAPYGIDWEQLLEVPDFKRVIREEMTRRNIWTIDDLRQNDRIIIRIATNTVGRAIWRAAKRGSRE